MSVNKFISALSHLAKIYPGMTLRYVQAMIAVSMNPGCSLNALSEILGIQPPTTSRLVFILADPTGRYGLLHMEVDPQSRRKKRIYLSFKGARLIHLLENQSM